ncbi:MAG: CsbD family protein [Spirochaetaceae bacterium]|nr:CsbD family protein [Myxococcales bacterium]MCB9724008.1 CsbD family protein [Spirochaetaceae bacterium]HPG24617.1 CsbD family protein [Myxococcota bacterium]
MGEEGGLIDEAKGRAKEAAGSLLDDDDLRKEGRVEQKVGQAKRKAEELIDQASEKAKDLVKGEDRA